jgi:sialate O-acetylesterase
MIRIDSSVHLFLLVLCFTSVDGVFRFANYYQDHMVLQRAPQQAIVWGYVDTFNTLITLTMNNKVYETISSSTASADSVGESIWSVKLDAQTEEGPFQVKITHPLANGTLETITLNDVLFGDVWVCSGQSNMGFSLRNMFNASIEIDNAYKYPKIRLFTATPQQSYIPQEELLSIELQWAVASNNSVGSGANSAVCWLYGRMIHEGLGGRPIGLVHASWGGTSIEWWSPPESLKECNITQTHQDSVENDSQQDTEVAVTLNNTVIYNAMIHPLTRMVIRGIIWYQGENNANPSHYTYICTFSKLIEHWRSIWYTRTNSTTDPTFPFGFVQLSTATNNSKYIGWFPWIRWHQTFDVGYVPNNVVPNVFMAVALDLRDDEGGVHPRNKLDVGYRLSRSGLAVAYGYNNISYQGPIIVDIAITPDSSKVNVTYSATVSPGIELRSPNGFEVCCVGNETCRLNETAWVETPASRIEGSPLTIALTVPSICASKQINALRYLWRMTPCLFKQAAVYSSEDSDLPAPPYIHYF